MNDFKDIKVKVNAQVISLYNNIATIALFLDDNLSSITAMNVSEWLESN